LDVSVSALNLAAIISVFMSDCFTGKRDELRLGHHEEAFASAVAELRITEMVKT
jgi:hypothetical protein